MVWLLSRRSSASGTGPTPQPLGRREGLQAFNGFIKAAQAGDAEASFQVGRAYVEGKVVPVSFADASHWLEQAARQGHLEAQAQFADLLASRGYRHQSGTGPVLASAA